jgi:hypothetical protein
MSNSEMLLLTTNINVCAFLRITNNNNNNNIKVKKVDKPCTYLSLLDEFWYLDDGVPIDVCVMIVV